MESKHREKFISLLKDSVLTLCKNGLMDDHGITRVEGLLGITLQNKEVFLINIKEELLPAVMLSCHQNNICPSDGRLAGLKTPPTTQLTVAETQPRSNCPKSSNMVSQTNSLHNETTFDSPTVKDQRNCKNKEDSFKAVSRLGFIERGSSAKASQIALHGELVSTAEGSEEDEEMNIVETSEPLELLHHAKDEPEDLVFNIPGPLIGQLQNFDAGFNYQTIVNNSSATSLWMKDPKDIGLPNSVVSCGYLPSMLGFPGCPASCSSPSTSSPPFASLSNILPSFYASSEMNRSMHQNQRFSLKMTSRQAKKYCCDICSYKSNRSYNLLRHVMHVHTSGGIPCTDCGVVLHHRMQLRAHRLEVHGDDGTGNLLREVKQEPEEPVNS